jgi:hypothetical protein
VDPDPDPQQWFSLWCSGVGQLEEERQVTANLSKNLELERRKVESLEQKAKVRDIG